MCRRAACLVPIVMLGVLVSQTGCQSGAPGAGFLSLFGLSKKPVVVGLEMESGVLDPFTPHEKLRKAMSEKIQRPVQLRLDLPGTLAPNLTLGFYDFACITPACYAQMKDRERFEVIAVSVDEAGRAARSAALVVAADGPIESVEDLRGKRVAFGPLGDGRTHLAALELLREHGLEKTDLSLSLLPIPGSLKHLPSMREVAQDVTQGSSDAGFIDEAALEALAESSDSREEPSRDRLRVIARTIPLPDKLVIRSPRAQPEIVSQVTDFLLTADEKHPDALRALLCSAYCQPTEELLASCARLVGQTAPTPAQPAAETPD